MSPKVYSIFFSFCATALLLFFVFREQSLADFLNVLNNIDVSLVALFCVISILGATFRMLRYRVLIKAIISEHVPGCGKLLITTFARNAFVDMFPLRLGETIYIYMLNRFGISVHIGISSFGVCIILDILVLLFLFGVLLLFNGTLPVAGGVGFSIYHLAILLLLLFLLLLFGLSYHVDTLVKYLVAALEDNLIAQSRIFKKIIHATKLIIVDLEFIKKSRKFAILIFYTLVLRVLKYSSLYILLFAVISPLGYKIESHFIFPVFVAFIAAEASASLPASGILGIGVYQGVWATIITLLGLNIKNPLSISFVVQIVSQIFAYFLGIISVLIFLVLMLKNKKSNGV